MEAFHVARAAREEATLFRRICRRNNRPGGGPVITMRNCSQAARTQAW